MNLNKFVPLIILFLLFISACEDQGDSLTANVRTPSITTISPDSGKAMDTVTVTGINFGTSQGTSKVSFSGTDVSTYLSWNNSQIKALVPSGITSGNIFVSMTVGGISSNFIPFKSLSTVSLTRFSTDIAPLISAHNCASCHGSNGGFSVSSYATILAGGGRGNTVVPGDTASSFILKKLRGTLTSGQGSRMPQGGPYLTNSEIQKFADWILQGALNN